jgi:hypothetical protein
VPSTKKSGGESPSSEGLHWFFPISNIPLRRTDKGARWRWACSFLIETGHKMGHTAHTQLSRAVRWRKEARERPKPRRIRIGAPMSRPYLNLIAASYRRICRALLESCGGSSFNSFQGGSGQPVGVAQCQKTRFGRNFAWLNSPSGC